MDLKEKNMNMKFIILTDGLKKIRVEENVFFLLFRALCGISIIIRAYKKDIIGLWFLFFFKLM